MHHAEKWIDRGEAAAAHREEKWKEGWLWIQIAPPNGKWRMASDFEMILALQQRIVTLEEKLKERIG